MDRLTKGLHKTCFLKNQALKQTHEKRKGFVVTPEVSCPPSKVAGCQTMGQWWVVEGEKSR